MTDTELHLLRVRFSTHTINGALRTFYGQYNTIQDAWKQVSYVDAWAKCEELATETEKTFFDEFAERVAGVSKMVAGDYGNGEYIYTWDMKGE